MMRNDMRLYLIQHGKATSAEQDPQRPLTEEGRQEVQRVAYLLKPLGLTVDRIWHSGKTRAHQTAQMYAGAFVVAEGLAAREGLSPNDPVASLRDELAVATQDTAIVGHLPFLSRLATLLLTGYESGDVIAFKNAGVVCLGRTADNRWQIEWVATPALAP